MVRPLALTLVLLSLALGMAACGGSGPPSVEYVLGTAPAAITAADTLTGRLVIEVKPVVLADYLDNTDLLVRSGNQLVPSKSGRWGERLSAGMTRALAASLAADLPKAAVVTKPIESPMRQVLVDVTAFEARDDRKVVLAARWVMTDGSGRNVLLSRTTVLAVSVGGMDDGRVVAAMTRAVDDLAAQIAAEVKGSVPPP